MRALSLGLSFLNKVALVCLVLVTGAALLVLSIPEYEKVKKLRADLEIREAEELEVMLEKDRVTRMLKSLKTDPSYLELHARDRLDLYREGESVVRFQRQP